MWFVSSVADVKDLTVNMFPLFVCVSRQRGRHGSVTAHPYDNLDTHCVYMLEHNRVMNVSNKDWIHVNRFIRSASPKGSSQDRISEVDTIAGLELVLVSYLPACVLDCIVLPGVRVLRMLENSPGSGRRQCNK